MSNVKVVMRNSDKAAAARRKAHAEAFEQGQRDEHDGKHDCPYPPGSILEHAWEQGQEAYRAIND